ncbi:MAG: cytochrome c peroxidase [Pseudomonadota bacterium]
MAAAERLVLLASLFLACSGPAEPRAGDSAPTLTSEQRAALLALRYDERPPAADPSNRFADHPDARAFGQRLFFERGFSGRLLEGDNDGGNATLGAQGESGRVSCAGCHLPESDFVDTRSPHGQVSLGAQWTLRKSPSLIDVAYAPLYNWDGRRDAIWNQALGVMESNREFNSGRLFVAEQVSRRYASEYEAVFGPLPPLSDAARFPQLDPDNAGCVEVNTSKGSRFVCRGLPGDGADYDGMTPSDQSLVSAVAANVGKALEAYIRQLRCGASRFDSWLDGEANALTPSEQRGALLFIGQAKCVKCHTGPRLTDDAFHNVGLSPAVVAVAIQDTDDRGAALGISDALKDPTSSAGPLSDGDRHQLPSSLGPELEGAFRTPGLRCNGAHPSFMHTGQLRTLEQVVEFFDRGGDGAGHYPGTSEIGALGLAEQQKADLSAFLASLNGAGPEARLRTPPAVGLP